LAETINGLYKAKLIHRRAPWKTKASLELATLEWASWLNHHRLLEPIGNLPVKPLLRSDLNQLASSKYGAIQHVCIFNFWKHTHQAPRLTN
jgi:putative transposase